jgi:hypothetical protein
MSFGDKIQQDENQTTTGYMHNRSRDENKNQFHEVA